MTEKITHIRLPLIDNYAQIIKSLAQRGRDDYQKFLITPLSNWSKQKPVETVSHIQNLIKMENLRNGPKLALLYKMALVKSTAPDQLDLSIPGNISLGFLNSMKNKNNIKKSDQALEFFNILSKNFKIYSEKEFERMNLKFENEISQAKEVEVEKLLNTNSESDQRELKIQQLSKDALLNIHSTIKTGNLKNIKNSIISFLLQFSDSSKPNRHMPAIEIIEKIQGNSTSLKKEILDTVAIIIYHEILKSIQTTQLDRAIKYIGKFTVLFRGNPKTPNYYEVDTFEKKLFQIIEKRNLWDKL